MPACGRQSCRQARFQAGLRILTDRNHYPWHDPGANADDPAYLFRVWIWMLYLIETGRFYAYSAWWRRRFGAKSPLESGLAGRTAGPTSAWPSLLRSLALAQLRFGQPRVHFQVLHSHLGELL